MPTESSLITKREAAEGCRLSCQVAVKRVNALGERQGKKIGTVLGIDLQAVDPVPGAEIHQLDFMDEGADDQVKDWLGGKADVVMSDMAASASGHKQTDHLRIIALCEAAAYFAFDVLEEGGTFVAKVLAGGAEGDPVVGGFPSATRSELEKDEKERARAEKAQKKKESKAPVKPIISTIKINVCQGHCKGWAFVR